MLKKSRKKFLVLYYKKAKIVAEKWEKTIGKWQGIGCSKCAKRRIITASTLVVIIANIDGGGFFRIALECPCT